MMKALFLALLAWLLVCVGPDPNQDKVTPDRPVTTRHCGMSWKASGRITALAIQPLVEDHVNWIVQTPFGWQRGLDSPEIRLVTSGHVLWGETDEGLAVTTNLARKRGIRTLLKPHVWIGRAWRAEIRMPDEAAWDQWFASYRRFILHYARLAEKLDIEALCIGTELRSTVNERPGAWRALIAEIRQVYGGQLTYAANWFAEFEEVPFWDELDYIGIQAYFPLSDGTDPTTEELKAGWQAHLDSIERVAKRFGKPVLFTELGYRSVAGTAATPWEWPSHGETTEIDLELQARCYEAFFETFWNKPWFAGAYFWKWHPSHFRAGGENNRGFTPQNKPAERVMAAWYGRTPP